MTRQTEPPLPENDEAERAVLGSLLIDPDARVRVSGILRPADFRLEIHQWIYAAELDASGSADFLTVQALLGQRGQLAAAGGPAYLTGLITAVPTSVHVEHYARIVADYATRRRLIDTAGQIVVKAYSEDAPGALAYARKALMDIDGPSQGGPVAAEAIARELYDRVEDWAMHPLDFGQVRDLPTYLPSLDRLIGGLCPGHLILVAGRPGMGKSSLVFEIGRRVAVNGGYVFIVSLEMPKGDILARWASAISGVETRKVKRGSCPEKYLGTGSADFFVSPDELGRYLGALSEVGSMGRMYIDDSRALSAAEIRSRALRLAQRVGGLDLLIVDHTGRMASEAVRGENTAKTEGRKSRALSDLAGELGCPVILAQQLRRLDGDKEPSLDELRDSGEHEENAHVVLGLYRKSYYKDGLLGDDKLALDVRSLKHREGPSNVKVRLRYEPTLTRFGEFEDKKNGKRSY